MTESREKGLPRVTAAALEIKVEYLASLLGILAAIRNEVVNQDEVWCVCGTGGIPVYPQRSRQSLN